MRLYRQRDVRSLEKVLDVNGKQFTHRFVVQVDQMQICFTYSLPI